MSGSCTKVEVLGVGNVIVSFKHDRNRLLVSTVRGNKESVTVVHGNQILPYVATKVRRL